jgi:hypothetical protein
LVAASLYVDYIFLDTDERRRMAQNPHEYLIEQLQFTGDESIGSSSNKIKLNFNHPCKELIYVVQPDANVNYCDMFESGKHLHMALGAQPFNYTDALDALPNTILAYAGQSSINGGAADDAAKNTGFVKEGLFETATQGLGTKDKHKDADTHLGADMTGKFGDGNALDGLGQGGAAAQISGVTDAGAYVLAETALNMHCWGENPVVTCKLQLNGQDRFSEREGSYFDVVQPFQHHTRHPDTGINLYSFALRPEEHQPSGTCNFSRIDNATLQLVVSADAIGGDKTAKVRVYAVNYNVLRIMSGMGGLAYSN